MDAAYRVHAQLGPGLLENVYECCLAYELQKRGLRVERQVPLPVVYDELPCEMAYRFDKRVDSRAIVEIKTTEKINPVHRVQLLTYLKLSGLRLGLPITFNTALVKHGISRVVL